MGKRDRTPTPPPQAPNNPFRSLAGKLGELPPGPAAAPPPAAATPAGPARAVVRYERKGHGGKEVTYVEKLELRPAVLEKWLKEARSSLGCGGRVEEGALVLQGDQRTRLPAWLEARGVRKVVVSG